MARANLVKFLKLVKPYLAVIFLQFGYAGMAIVAKSALNEGMSPFTYAVYRNVFAAVLFAPFAVAFERKIWPKMTVSILLKIMALALLELEKVKMRKLHSQAKILGTIVTIGGAMIMTLVKGPNIGLPWTKHTHHIQTQTTLHSQQDFIKGAVMVATGCFCWASFYILQGHGYCLPKSALNEGMSPFTTQSTGIVFAAVPSLPPRFAGRRRKVFSPNYTLPPARSNPDILAIDISKDLEYVADDATPVSTPNVDGCKGLSNASGIIIVLQFPDIASSTGWFSPPLLCDGTILVRCTMPKEKTGVIMKEKGPVFVTAFNPLSMIIVAIMGSFMLSEQLDFGKALGAGVIVIGLYMVLWGKKQDRDSPELINDQVAPVDKSPSSTLVKFPIKQEPINTPKAIVGDEAV
nr:WAT1-related protein At2g39510-like [Ipomoea batatas]